MPLISDLLHKVYPLFPDDSRTAHLSHPTQKVKTSISSTEDRVKQIHSFIDVKRAVLLAQRWRDIHHIIR